LYLCGGPDLPPAAARGFEQRGTEAITDRRRTVRRCSGLTRRRDHGRRRLRATFSPHSRRATGIATCAVRAACYGDRPTDQPPNRGTVSQRGLRPRCRRSTRGRRCTISAPGTCRRSSTVARGCRPTHHLRATATYTVGKSRIRPAHIASRNGWRESC